MHFVVTFIIAMVAYVVDVLPAYSLEDFHPAIIYESATNGDNAFIDSMRNGALRAKEDVGIEYKEYRLLDEKNRIEFIRDIAESGATHIIAVGFQNVVPILTLAEDYPEIKFSVIDGVVPPLFANVQSVNFKDHEGAFLVGMIAGYTTSTNKIGFIGGMDVPIIDNFALGFEQGAKYANPNVEVIRDNIGDDTSAWSNPERANILAKKQFSNGVDIIFAAAGGSSIGVLQAAAETGKLAIGVDTNQNGLYPNAVLTSMVKRVDKAVYEILVDSFSGRWESGIKYLGIRENALDYAVDINNRKLISKTIIEKVETTKDRIIRGLVKVKSNKTY